ncbi:hypothetical protein J5N97_013381 [Dioscorea zingiberensis]|uniref:DUF1995 domain-containing protein n=1 Tax=Dioscorea zingiberensis TaxID=325984 RepID=A0A9D5CSV2_9LILI|nr:hypothetical protein J5N97_013381 [Dioscorea zingiberensis]
MASCSLSVTSYHHHRHHHHHHHHQQQQQHKLNNGNKNCSFSFSNGFPRLSPAIVPISRAKFEKFDGPDSITEGPPIADQPRTSQSQDEDLEDDRDLPPDLVGAIRQSGQASAAFISSGGMRAIVELLIPQLQFLDAEGAQAELWELSRIFLETLMEETGLQKVKAIFPDAGAAALLKYQWKDATFGFSSLSDRKPVQDEDEVVVMVVPDYQMLEYVERIASRLSNDPPRPLIMWNPRLVSERCWGWLQCSEIAQVFFKHF